MMWFVVGFFAAAVVYLVDFIVRRKGWKNNTAKEKTSLILTLVFSMPYVFVSFLGLFAGIVGNGATNAFVRIYRDIVIFVGPFTGIVCLAAVIASIVLRKKDKASASIAVQIAAFIYCVLIIIGI